MASKPSTSIPEIPPAPKPESGRSGPALRLTTGIRTDFGSDALTIEDTVTNLGNNPVEHQMLYHINYGPPLLEKGSRMLAPFKRVAPRDPRSAEGIETFDLYGEAQVGFWNRPVIMN